MNLVITLELFNLFLPFTEDYDEESATAHVRRVLDIVACTTYFGPSANRDSKADKNAPDTTKASKKSSKSNGGNNKQQHSSPPPTPSSPAAAAAAKDAASIDGEGEMSSACPKLGSFYEFFSLSHLTPPLQCKCLSSSYFGAKFQLSLFFSPGY